MDECYDVYKATKVHHDPCFDTGGLASETVNRPLNSSPSLSVSLRFNGHFPGEPGLVSFIAANDDGSGGDNWSCKSCKAPVKSLPPTFYFLPSFFQAGCPSCCPTNSVKALKEN